MENQMTVQETNVNMSALGIFGSRENYTLSVNLAKSFAQSTIVPKEYQGNAANCLIAIDMATRLGVSPLMVMQQLYVVNGHPAWSSQFLAAMINNSNRFQTPIKYEMGGDGDDRYCIAYVIDKNNEKIEGPKIDIHMAKMEGWYGKNGSKWKTMPDVMLRYRAVSFFARLHCGDLTMGFPTTEEAVEYVDAEYTSVSNKVEAEIKNNANRVEVDIDTATTPEFAPAQEPIPDPGF